MTRRITAGLLLAGILAFTGQAVAFDSPIADILVLDGLQIDAANPLTFVFEKTDPNIRTLAIKWDFTYEALSPSWGSELGITVVAPDGTTTDLGSDGNWCDPCDFNFGFTDTSGLFSSGGAVDLGGLDYGLGFWEITIGESFDDLGIDGQFLQGVLAINKVPEPASLWLVGLSLLGLAACRRRVV